MRDIGHCRDCGTAYLPPESLEYPAAGVEASLTWCARCKPPTPIGTTTVDERRADADTTPTLRARPARPRRAGAAPRPRVTDAGGDPSGRRRR